MSYSLLELLTSLFVVLQIPVVKVSDLVAPFSFAKPFVAVAAVVAETDVVAVADVDVAEAARVPA